MRRFFARTALLALFVAATLPPLVVLCRGRSPSRFSPVNLPTWERKAPHPARARGTLRALPLPPSRVQFDKSVVQAVLQANENRLLSGIESAGKPPTAAAGSAGAWLESACALGRQDRALAAKQDRVALRLMTAEDADGYLAAGQGRNRWAASQVQAESRNLRGLLACYALTHHVAVIYAAMQAGDLLVSAPELAASVRRPFLLRLDKTSAHKASPTPTASLVLPLARLYLMTGQERYEHWALQQARAGQADAPGLCALYLATGQAAWLHQAQVLWKQSAAQGKADPDAAACLLAATGAPGYARVARSRPAPWPCPLSAGSVALTQTPYGLSVNTWASAHFLWKGGWWTQHTAKTTGGLLQTTLSLSAKQPVKAALSFPTGGVAITADMNHMPVLGQPQPGLLALTRVWRAGDRLVLTALPGPVAVQTVPRPRSAAPPSIGRPSRR